MAALPPRGTQSIYRAGTLLKVLGTRKGIGWRITDLARQCGLDISTTHRILSCLAAAGLARQRSNDRRYVPGQVVFELSLTVPVYSLFQEACHKSLVKLSRKTGWVGSLHLRSGDESVCIDRVGASSMQLMIEAGTRRPLSHFAHGMSILLALPESQQAAIFKSNNERFPLATRRAGGYRNILKRSIQLGAGLSLGDIVPGIAGVAVPILDVKRGPVASIGLTGPMEEFTEARIVSAKALLEEEARRIEVEEREHILELGIE